MLSLATGLAHSGSDLSLLVPEIEDMYSSPYLRPSESPITVEVNCTNPGMEGAWELSILGAVIAALHLGSLTPADDGL